MTSQGDKLAGVDPEPLRQQLRRETNPKAIKRLTRPSSKSVPTVSREYMPSDPV